MTAHDIQPLGVLALHIDKAALASGSPKPLVIREFDARGRNTRAWYANAIEILGPSKFILNRENPLPPAGTYAWIETRAMVRYYD